MELPGVLSNTLLDKEDEKWTS
eukprot:gene18572-24297_t